MTSSAEQPQPLRVVVTAVKDWIERLGWVWVEGQVIEIKRRAGSRAYLTLRDKLSDDSVSLGLTQLVLETAGPLTEGATVVAHVRPSFYRGRGSFSFSCDELRPVGEGRLLAQLEQRKRLLQAEGLFDPRRKRRLPFLPRAVGLITGAASAAERDVVENARRRWPQVAIRTVHTLVQGPNAAEQVMQAIRRLDTDPRVEVIVIARGGGSIEDLLPFSDEGVVRAVAACTTPVVSAIGHEQDMPILDLVADLRASTPTDAAKRIVPDVVDERERVAGARSRLQQAVQARLRRERDGLAALRTRPVLADPTATYAIGREQITGLHQRGRTAVLRRISTDRTQVEHLRSRATAMSPQATLDRGYSILIDPDGRAITRVSDVDPDDELTARVADGELTVAVRSARSHPIPGKSRS